MRSLKEVLFDEALYWKDEARRLEKELGEYDYLTSIAQSKYNALLNVVNNSGYLPEWDNFIKSIAIKRGII